MQIPRTCFVCARPTQGTGALGGAMCSRCQRSFERFKQRDATIGGLMQWAAQRARAEALNAREALRSGG